MDDFVCNKLTEWGFSDLIQTFKDHEVDQEALYCLDDHNIDKLISKAGTSAKFKNKLKLLKSQQECQEPAHSAQVLPSTRDRSDKVKHKLDPQVEENKNQTPTKRPRDTVTGTDKEDRKLREVKRIMHTVDNKLHSQKNTELNDFLRKKIRKLKRDKREIIGVFGKTGAGKSSLINAVIGEKHLLPSGNINACTAVMIEVEANTSNQKYEAHIEFITKEEWNDELFWSLKTLCGDNGDEEGKSAEDDTEYHDNVEKLTALYGKEWKKKSAEDLMEAKYFKDVPEFFQTKKKSFSCNSGKELSAKFLKYIRSGSSEENSEEVERFYWPLVKCVTVKVPNNDLLQHVTLVDLPGNGDRNKSRDQMWKRTVGDCSTVWIVAEINRAASETETWDILKSACSIMGNGGECQNIHFICTKTDTADDDENSEAGVGHMFKTNIVAKKKVRQEFNKLKDVKKQFMGDCFKVFTVSAKEFLKPTRLTPEQTEIPELQKFLRSLNDQHSETLNYVFGAYGILSLMKGARCGDVAAKKVSVWPELVEKLTREKEKVSKSMKDAYGVLEIQLETGVENSITSCKTSLKKILYPPKQSGSGFHRTLKCVVKNNGVHKRGKNKKEININKTLASLLSEKIDEEFRNTFPNDGNSGPFYGAINAFTLDTEKLIQNYTDVELQLRFLKTEEEKMKVKLSRIIRQRKKTIYNSLVGTIKETMQECYTRAAAVTGTDSLYNMREILKSHVQESKDTMFELAKNIMLTQLDELMRYILEKLTDTMQRSIKASLKMNDNSIPDISTEYSLVESYYKDLKGPDEETSSLWPDSDDSMGSPCSAAAAETIRLQTLKLMKSSPCLTVVSGKTNKTI